MAQDDDFKAGCGCLFIIFLIVGSVISSINGCRDEKKSANLTPDYSSRPSEEGHFVNKGYGTLRAQGFRVEGGVGYLTLNNGHVLKMWRNGYGEYEGRYDGRSYTARKTVDGYEIRATR